MDFPIEKVIQLELSSCHSNCNKGIMIQPSLRNITQWQIYFFPASGVFKSCILTCFIYFDNFPNDVPQVVFQSGVVHPYVDHSTFRYDTSPFFTEWNLQTRVYSLLNSIYDSLVDIPLPTKICANQEAARFLKQGVSTYEKKALEELPRSEDPNNQNEINTPKRWNATKEKLMLSLFGQTSAK
ncbi:Ubiquitin-conjugating enzyme family protein [Tritrichomonas foetus]|uniref:Ubiquitin-conjugating enzyme family protein n=1 Tax=Tritrichomonas foetus TaxID=1144522 RepID=A0A1J4KD58_9EUKA|nr:Ubiquitin-conjugating enzyme family protein [Tritrichomonas foetus]|eukprot:OHT08872.1 Ubiquitin-conjugating enzyme family protein [Tritrichomonas foetus]